MFAARLKGASKVWIAVLALAGYGIFPVYASGDIESGKYQLGGYAFWQFGQIVDGSYNLGATPEDPTPISHQWTTSALLGLSIEAHPHPNLKVMLSPEFKLYYPYPEEPNQPPTIRPNNVGFINEGYGMVSIGDSQRPVAKLTLGIFNYKYNPDATNLGEYLFRTGTYPTYIITDFDFPKARLLGMRVSCDYIENFGADLLFTSEYQYYPLYDFSLAGIFQYTFLQGISIGAGFDLARVIPANDQKTSPKIKKNKDGVGYNEYITQNGDTAYYSFKATKLMGRLSFDLKAFIPTLANFLGPNDLKIYGEATVVGIEGYKAKADNLHPAYYNDMRRRIPIMGGINLPVFKILDVFSAELEYFPSYLPNNYKMVLESWTPMPYVQATSYKPEKYDKGFFRWSLHARKEVLNGFEILGQLAFDHLRTTYKDGSTDTFECLTLPGNWYWVMKTVYSF